MAPTDPFAEAPSPPHDPGLSPQTQSGLGLLGRWLVACGVDYGILCGVVLWLFFSVPGPGAPLAALGLALVFMALFQGVGEALAGGTPGQRLAGLRLIAPGTAAPPPLGVVLRRQILRISLVWGFLAALIYWRYWARASAEDRQAAATTGGETTGWAWLFIER